MRLYYYEEDKTRAEVTALLEIRHPHAVKKWGQKYRREGASAFWKAKGRPRKHETEQAELERLRMENFFRYLKEEYLRKFQKPPLKIQSNSLMNIFTFITMNGYNENKTDTYETRCLSIWPVGTLFFVLLFGCSLH